MVLDVSASYSRLILKQAEIFVYNRDVFSRSKEPKAQAVTVTSSSTVLEAYEPPPDTLANQNDLTAWQELFRARRKWALEVVERARDLAEDGRKHFDAFDIMERGVGVAVGNLDAHVQVLEGRHNEAQDWAERLQTEQKNAVSSVDMALPNLKRLPADVRFRELLPLLAKTDEDPNASQTKKGGLDSFVEFQRLHEATGAVRASLGSLSERTASLASRVDHVFKAAGELFDTVEKTHTQSIAVLQSDTGQLLEEIEVIANKVASDCERVCGLPAGQKSIPQASKMALLHTKDYLPSLRDYSAEMGNLVKQTIAQRNLAASRVISNMQKVAEVEGLFANADVQVKNLDFQVDDDDALDLTNLVVQLPFIYGALLLESIRRREWAQKIRDESTNLAEDIAGYREEEEKRRRRWHKTIGGVVVEDTANAAVLNFELNLHPDLGAWPDVDRQDVLDYIAVLKRLPDQGEVIEELEAGFKDLDKPTRRQARAVRNFKNGSFHDVQTGGGSFFLKNSDEIRALRDSNQKLEEEIKGQKSRVRRLEDLLYKQSQAGRIASGNVFQTSDAAARDLPTPEPYSPTLETAENLSRKASANSRRTSATGTTEERALAKRIVSLEADLHKQKHVNEELEKLVHGRHQTNTNIKTKLEETESTKKDLMANLEAQQREFADERRLLEEEIEKHRTRHEEVEEELDRILGSRDAEVGLEEKLRSLESELEHTKAALEARERDVKEHEEMQEEQRSALSNIHKSLDADATIPKSSAELVHNLENLIEKTLRQAQDLSLLVATTKSEKEELQALLDRKEKESINTREAFQGLEEELSSLRNDMSTEEATTKSLTEELGDARQQLKNLRAKFAEGETGSEVLQQRLTEQAGRASALATELAQAKSHVNSLDVELSSLQRRHKSLVSASTKDTNVLEQRSLKARELTNRLVAYHQELTRLLGSLGLSILQRDGNMVIQRSSKAVNATATSNEQMASISGSAMLQSVLSAFDSSIDPMLSSWMHTESTDDENQRFSDLLAKLDQFNLTTFSEAVIKLRRDVEWTGKKWKMEARSYRDKYHRAQGEAHEKIAYRSFKEGDLALFLPTRNQATRPWAAFNIGAPHYFLREQESHKLRNREWLVARISKVEERIVDLSKTMNNSLKADRGTSDKVSESGVSLEDDNPFELSDGLRWYLLDAAEEKPGAPATPSVGKSTVASATVDAKGSIRMKKPGVGNDASAKLNKSLESRRSSSNSKRGSISGGSGPAKENNEEPAPQTGGTAPPSPSGATPKPPSVTDQRPVSRGSAHRNAPSKSSGLGIEIKEPEDNTVQTLSDEVRRDQLWGP